VDINSLKYSIYKDICYELIQTIILETGKYNQLIGEIKGDGIKGLGLIEQSLPLIGLLESKDFNQLIIKPTANKCEEGGKYIDSIKLYNLANDYNTVIIILNKLLAKELSKIKLKQDSGGQQNKPILIMNSNIDTNITLEELGSLVEQIIEYYSHFQHIYSNINEKSFKILKIFLNLVKFIKYFQLEQYDLSLNLMIDLDLLPLKQISYGSGNNNIEFNRNIEEQSQRLIAQKAEEFNNMDDLKIQFSNYNNQDLS
jgi:nuclear pore complex protein Nup93